MLIDQSASTDTLVSAGVAVPDAILATSPSVASWRGMVADDLFVFACLHGVELNAGILASLRAAEFPNCLALPPVTREGAEARMLMARTVENKDSTFSASLDELAADYAAIYLTGRYRASPNESAWLDEDGLERQEPMFAVREWYFKYELGAGDWRKRQDDNLSLQLQFLGHLCNQAADDAALRPAADFLDAHLLLWIDRFAERVASRAATPFYAAIGMLTADYLHALRATLAELSDAPCPPPVLP